MGPVGLTGPIGPNGPIGPPGPVGPTGATQRFDLTGTIGSSGGVTGTLPAAAVAGSHLPTISCYTSSDGVTWLSIADFTSSTTLPWCELTGIGTTTPGITISNGIPGYFFYMIAVF